MNDSRKVTTLGWLLGAAIAAIIVLSVNLVRVQEASEELYNTVCDTDAKISVLTLPIWQITSDKGVVYYVRAADRFDAERYYRGVVRYGDMSLNSTSITVIGAGQENINE